MLLAQKLAGFTPGESDKMRKTLVKKSLDTIGKKGAERDALRKQFVNGAANLTGLPEDKLHKLFDRIEYFSVYGFNKSHAVAYAIDSYYSAWLHTHHEKTWLATVLQSENSSPKGLQKTISEIKQMGYKFVPADINYSGDEWTYSEDRASFVPPLTSVKGVGVNAVQEIMLRRPYNSLHNLLYDEDDMWKHSKMNKTCFSALCKIEAFSSLEELTTGAIRNHKQMHDIIIDNYEILRKSAYGMTMRKAQKSGALPILPSLIRDTSDIEDWSRSEKLMMYYDLTATVPRDLLYPDGVLDKIKKSDIPPMTGLSGKTRVVAWLCIQEIIKKKTKKGKTFYRLKVCDDHNNMSWLRVWGFLPYEAVPFSIWLADVQNDPDWGASTSGSKMKPLVL
jgi:DNA polymerase III alpha subunit